MIVYCHTCGSRNLRPSRLQLKDLLHFFALRYPVRCRHCRKRFYVSIFSLRKLRREAHTQRDGKQAAGGIPSAADSDRQKSEPLR
jgi:hypothetical protein